MTKAYTRYIIKVTSQEQVDILVAVLSDLGIEGFEEHETELLASGPDGSLDTTAINSFLADGGYSFQTEQVQEQNWNAVWESNFDPVEVGDFLYIRAAFHQAKTGFRHEIVITPKMSFGTGHHATTYMMVQLMAEIDFEGKHVFDFGTGTGILAILAEKLGAAATLASDYDEWSVLNANENLNINACGKIEVALADQPPADDSFDIVLANLNKNVILQFGRQLDSILKPAGTLLLSGLLTTDEKEIREMTAELGLKFEKMIEKNGWIALKFSKSFE